MIFQKYETYSVCVRVCVCVCVCVCVEKNEMGGACARMGRGVQGSGGETWGKETIGETQTQMGG